jgi:hypothetical protein
MNQAQLPISVSNLGLCLAFEGANIGQVSCGYQGHSGECELADGVSYRDMHEVSESSRAGNFIVPLSPTTFARAFAGSYLQDIRGAELNFPSCRYAIIIENISEEPLCLSVP